MRERRVLPDEQDQRQTQERVGLEASGRTVGQFGDGEVDLLPLEEFLRLRLAGFLEAELHQRGVTVQFLEEFGDVVAQGLGAGRQTQALPGLAAQLGGDGIQILEERRDELGQTLPGRSEGEGTALKQGGTQSFFQREHLTADGRLLDPIGHLAHRRADATVLGDVIEKFQMVNIHPQPSVERSRANVQRRARRPPAAGETPGIDPSKEFHGLRHVADDGENIVGCQGPEASRKHTQTAGGENPRRPVHQTAG